MRAITLDPANLFFRQSLVLTYSKADQLENAESQLHVMEAVDPENLFALTNLGLYLAEKREAYAESLTWFKRALLENPRDPQLVGFLIWYTYRAGNVREAARLIAHSGSYARGDSVREKQREIILNASRLR